MESGYSEDTSYPHVPIQPLDHANVEFNPQAALEMRGFENAYYEQDISSYEPHGRFSHPADLQQPPQQGGEDATPNPPSSLPQDIVEEHSPTSGRHKHRSSREGREHRSHKDHHRTHEEKQKRRERKEKKRRKEERKRQRREERSRKAAGLPPLNEGGSSSLGKVRILEGEEAVVKEDSFDMKELTSGSIESRDEAGVVSVRNLQSSVGKDEDAENVGGMGEGVGGLYEDGRYPLIEEGEVLGEESRPGLTSYLDEIVRRIKSRKGRKQTWTNEECLEFVQRVHEQMKEAKEADDVAISEKKPAIAKLQILDTVVSVLAKPKWREWFVSEGCCQVLASWLAPMPEKPLPNLSVRRKVLELLHKLPINSQELQHDGLGAVLVELWKHKEETEENRVLIRGLVQQWMRPLLGVGGAYKDYFSQLDTEARDRVASIEGNGGGGGGDYGVERGGMGSSTLGGDGSNLGLTLPDNDENDRYRKARIPVNLGYQFAIQPKPQVTHGGGVKKGKHIGRIGGGRKNG